MCRIFGSVEPAPGREVLDAMEPPLRAGGPDHYGLYLDDGAAIGHRRLSVIDLSERANQPMRFGDLVMSYNGEVYNYREIRRELEGEYTFTTQSDSEVVLKAFHKWGVEAAKRFRGMFAVAFWDRRRRSLTLIRDRAGVKPLYYARQGERFLFASELTAIARHPGFTPRLDPAAAGLYFQLGFVPAPYGIYAGSRKVEPGGWLEYREGQVRTGRYWRVEEADALPPLSGTEEELAEELEALLRESFRYRMVADVEVGIFLSGGVDSPLLASLLSRDYDLRSYTIGFRDPAHNEADIAARVARILGTRHTEYFFDLPDLLRILPRMPQLYDEPFADASMLPTYLVAELAGRDLKVVLSADGADELFWGYPSNFTGARRYARYRRMGWLRPLLAAVPHYKARRLSTLLGRDPMAYKLAERSRFLPGEFRTPPGALALPKCTERYEECAFRFDFRYFLTDDVLVKVDRSTMAHSLEAREPFLDHRIVEFARRLPAAFKYRDGETKYLLRRLLAKHLPEEIVRLPKRGFTVPLKRWLRDELRDEVMETVRGTPVLAELLPGVASVTETFYRTGRRTRELWLLYLFALWHRHHLEGR